MNQAKGNPYKHFLAMWSWPPSGEWWYSGSRGSHLITSGSLVIIRKVGTHKASRYYPASNTRLEADPVPLGSAKWWCEVGCCLPKQVKQNMSRHRGRQENKRVGSVAACHWRSAGGPSCNPLWQLASGAGGPLVLCL